MITDTERTFLRVQRIARLATVAADGTPDVVSVRYQMRGDELLLGGPGFDTTAAWANLQGGGRAAVLVEDRHGDLPDRGVLVHGVGRPVAGAAFPLVAVSPTLVRGFGLDTGPLG